MKKLFLLCLLPLLAHAQSDVRFISSPTLSPDGQTLYFSYAGDLWRMRAGEPMATRLTGMDGQETNARVSPDGQWLAFSGSPSGNQDLYVMPTAGGPIRQLTFHEADDELNSWSWDSKTLYFTSDRMSRQAGFRVAVEGGTPTPVFTHYFNNAHDLHEHPTSGELFFNDTWESSYFTYRQGYHGPYNPDIQSYNPKTGAYKKYTTYDGKDFWPTIDRNGTLYFVSTEGNGTYNLYTWANNQPKRLTNFDSPVREPQVSADGTKVVFEKDYQLWLYDTQAGTARQVPVQAPQYNPLPQAQDFDVKGEISDFDVSPDNQKLAFVSRGELFVSDVEGKFIRQLRTNPTERVEEVKWLDDNRTLLFSQTADGYPNWFTMAADGSGTPQQRTQDTQSNRLISLNPARTQAVYLSGRNEVRLMNLKNFTSKTLVNDELWGFYNPVPRFSPDGAYVAFTAYRDFEQDIFVHHLATGETHNLTQTGVSESAPFWSPDGRSLFFDGNLTQPNYPMGAGEVHIYQMMLHPYDAPYRSDELARLFTAETPAQDNGKAKKKKKDADAQPEPKAPPVTIDFREPMERLHQRGPEFGSQADPYVIEQDGQLVLFYVSDHAEGNRTLWKTVIAPFDENKTSQVTGLDNVGSYALAGAKGSYYLLTNGKLYTLNTKEGKVEPITLSYHFARNLENEFQQMFYELWAGLEENYYAENFHGADWRAVRDRYATYLPDVASRADLRRLITDMLGELNSSHLGFSSSGDEEKPFYQTKTATVGLVFDHENPYRVQALVTEGPALQTDSTGTAKNIRPGDVLTHVNGVAVAPDRNRESYFTAPTLDQEMVLTFSRSGRSHDVKLHPESYYAFRDRLYEEWIDSNQRYVDQHSDERIAYIHMKNMGQGELERFMREMVSEGYRKDALILDLRYNTGGNVHDKVLQFLSRRPYLRWKYREGQPTPQPNFAMADKPIILLTNEQSLSDAEVTAAGFKALQLGKIVGTDTYHWIIFTSGKGLVDGSFYRLPSWGTYSLDGKDLEATGVQPDVEVPETFADRQQGKQPQLDRAIQEIKSMWK
ncbi:tricorn protease [Catalinimonas alkaloidigena]|uniref:Tricorn protease homolog n=1 Tax=Catalinimonas alkaloidigena TaxID=1075417 RepID=A0A1G9A4G6_9BACT|nr:S41 family peptidase [Catalinimonas alkaloidigena]SDK21485.1 tricorn protease [Catalinimonas alkaloidigena]